MIRVDGPGFGESKRPRLGYADALLARFLSDFRREVYAEACGLIAAGHAAGIAPFASKRHGLAFRDWLLAAPTWRCPSRGWRAHSHTFSASRALLEAPLLGPLIQSRNTRGLMVWLTAAQALQHPLTAVIADQSPPDR